MSHGGIQQRHPYRGFGWLKPTSVYQKLAMANAIYGNFVLLPYLYL
jgi:hypothetical protein